MQAANREPHRFSVAIPASVVSDTPHLREKTAKLGSIARACSIFGVNEIIVYPDNPQQSQDTDAKLCAEILQYLETPQYLRKRLFKLSPELRFIGILPPLQTPHHNVPRSKSAVKAGDLREGIVTSRSGHSLKIDAGLEETVSTTGDNRTGERVTLRLVRVQEELQGEIVDASKISIPGGNMRPIYWGYRVYKAKSLGRILSQQRWELKVGTSRYGTPIQEALPFLSEGIKTSRSMLIAFGSPKMGLGEILEKEKLDPNGAFQYFVNTVPDQQTATVRTEEAIFVSLGILNLAAKLAG